MDPERFWHALLFRDRYNHLGILAAIPPELQETLSQNPGALTQVPLNLCGGFSTERMSLCVRLLTNFGPYARPHCNLAGF